MTSDADEAAAVELVEVAHNGTDAEWFARTGHCGRCGQPGDWCQCYPADACGCRDLHVMGSGRGRDPVEVFADTAPTDYPALF